MSNTSPDIRPPSTAHTPAARVAAARPEPGLSYPSNRHHSRRTVSAIATATAVVDAPIAAGERGHVWYKGSWWRACCNQSILLPAKTRVRVIGRQGLTLIVAPLSCSMD